MKTRCYTKKHNSLGQATIEFTFAMVIIALLIFSLIKVFRWAGMDYAEHGWEREQGLPLVQDRLGNVDSEHNNPLRTKRLNAFSRNL